MKKIAGLFCLLLLAISVCGCGAQTGKASANATPTIRIITWSNEGTVDALMKINQKFEKETGIKVELTEVSSKDYESLLNTRLAANNVDVFCYTTDSKAFAQPVVDWAPTEQLTWESIITGGNALDLSGYDWINNWSTGASACRYKDGIYGIATGMTIMNGIFYNKAMFEENGWTEPKTWDEFIELCEDIQMSGIAPLTVGGGDTWPVQMLSNAVVYTVEEGNEEQLAEGLWKGTRKFNDEKSLKIFERENLMLSYMEDGYMGVGYSDVPARFVAGKAAMLYDGSWNSTQIEGADYNFDYGYFPLPGDTKCNFSGKYDLTFGINANSENVEAAVKWLEFFSQPENYSVYVNTNGFVPTMADIKSENRFLNILGDRVNTVERNYECYNRVPTNVGSYATFDPINLEITGGEFARPSDLADAAQADWDAALSALDM